jgi:hypothetical protein
MSDPTARAAIREIYRQVGAPDWAAPNLDALADVLRDLGWLPEGTVVIGSSAVPGVRAVLERAVAESAGSARPVVLARGGPDRGGAD